jgi:hypothetical protein
MPSTDILLDLALLRPYFLMSAHRGADLTWPAAASLFFLPDGLSDAMLSTSILNCFPSS